jgi:hypothetical protein
VLLLTQDAFVNGFPTHLNPNGNEQIPYIFMTFEVFLLIKRRYGLLHSFTPIDRETQ